MFCLTVLNLLWGTLVCCRKFLVSKNFMSKKVRGLLLFLSKIFGPTVPGKIVEEFFNVFQNIWFQKMFWKRLMVVGGSGFHDFSSQFFCLTVPKVFVRVSLLVWGKLWYRKILWIRRGGASPSSSEYFSSHIAEKTLWGDIQCFRKTRVSKSFIHKKGISRCFVWRFLFHYQETS